MISALQQWEAWQRKPALSLVTEMNDIAVWWDVCSDNRASAYPEPFV